MVMAIHNLRLFTQGGTQIDMRGHTSPVGRVGIGYRFVFFKLAMQPFFYLEQVGSQPGWAMKFRFEYCGRYLLGGTSADNT